MAACREPGAMEAGSRSPFSMQQRSATLFSTDPKARELRHFVGSRNHEARLKSRAALGSFLVEQRRLPGGRDVKERLEWREDVKERLEWREAADRSLRMLLLNQELATGKGLHEQDMHRMRCDQLDETYSWFVKHARKEASKERPAPSYLRFDSGTAPMPGSLRTPPPSTLPMVREHATHLPKLAGASPPTQSAVSCSVGSLGSPRALPGASNPSSPTFRTTSRAVARRGGVIVGQP